MLRTDPPTLPLARRHRPGPRRAARAGRLRRRRTARRWRPVAAAPRRPPAPPCAARDRHPGAAGRRGRRAACRTSGTSASCPTGRCWSPSARAGCRCCRAPQPGATVQPVRADLADVYARGEGGLMGLVVHPDFAQSRRFTTCQTHAEGGTRHRRPAGHLAAVRRRQRRPSGCGTRWSAGCRSTRPAGTPAAGRPSPPTARCWSAPGTPRAARSRRTSNSLGGKVLRIDLATGGPPPDNPFVDAENPAQRLIWDYGHRNVQGVAVQPGHRARRTRPSTARAPTTRSTCCGRARTTAGTRRRAARSAATTSRCR